MRNPFETTVTDEIRKAKKVLYVVVNVVLAYYGVVVLVRGTVDLFFEKGQGLMFVAIGLVGLRLWLRRTEPWVADGYVLTEEKGD